MHSLIFYYLFCLYFISFRFWIRNFFFFFSNYSNEFSFFFLQFSATVVKLVEKLTDPQSQLGNYYFFVFLFWFSCLFGFSLFNEWIAAFFRWRITTFFHFFFFKMNNWYVCLLIIISFFLQYWYRCKISRTILSFFSLFYVMWIFIWIIAKEMARNGNISRKSKEINSYKVKQIEKTKRNKKKEKKKKKIIRDCINNWNANSIDLELLMLFLIGLLISNLISDNLRWALHSLYFAVKTSNHLFQNLTRKSPELSQRKEKTRQSRNQVCFFFK